VNPDQTELSDRALAARACAGDGAAFAMIVNRHKLALFRLVAKLIGDDDDALDIVQETFVAAHRALGRYDPDRPMRAWLTRIAVNKARDWRRRRAVRRLISMVMPDGYAELPTDAPTTDTIVDDRAELVRVRAAVAALPANLRETLVLRTFDGMSQLEAASLLGVTEKTIETRLYRARRALKRALENGA